MTGWAGPWAPEDASWLAAKAGAGPRCRTRPRRPPRGRPRGAARRGEAPAAAPACRRGAADRLRPGGRRQRSSRSGVGGPPKGSLSSRSLREEQSADSVEPTERAVCARQPHRQHRQQDTTFPILDVTLVITGIRRLMQDTLDVLLPLLRTEEMLSCCLQHLNHLKDQTKTADSIEDSVLSGAVDAVDAVGGPRRRAFSEQE